MSWIPDEFRTRVFRLMLFCAAVTVVIAGIVLAVQSIRGCLEERHVLSAQCDDRCEAEGFSKGDITNIASEGGAAVHEVCMCYKMLALPVEQLNRKNHVQEQETDRPEQ